MNELQLPAIEVRQDGSRLVITKMTVEQLRTFTVIERFDTSRAFSDVAQGYQRPEETPRVKKFANWLRHELERQNKVRMPSAILLSGRGTDIAVSGNGTIKLKRCTPLPLVDGQHRRAGFLFAIDEKEMDSFRDYELPVVIMLDIDKLEEMRQFNVVNSTQKSVRTDLVNMILTQLAESEGDDAVRSADQWKVVVSQVVKRLNSEPDGPWNDQIVMPDQGAYSKEQQAATPHLRHKRVARATSMMTALKPIEAYLYEHFTGDLGLQGRSDRLAEIVSAYWGAVRELCPDCFERADDYVMLKTPGIFALGRLCLRVMKDMYTGRREWTQSEFKSFLEACSELSNPAFWAVGSNEGDRGDAAKYGSMKGFAELADLLYQSLRS